jgi:multidrug efflux system membrane fusion protein
MGTTDGDATPHTGFLQLVDNQVDAQSGTVRVRAVFDNADGALMPGQFARCAGPGQKVPALLINERAVGTDQNKRSSGGGRRQHRLPRGQLGAPVNGLRVVASGLKAGERSSSTACSGCAPASRWRRSGCPWTPRASRPNQKPAGERPEPRPRCHRA